MKPPCHHFDSSNAKRCLGEEGHPGECTFDQYDVFQSIGRRAYDAWHKRMDREAAAVFKSAAVTYVPRPTIADYEVTDRDGNVLSDGAILKPGEAYFMRARVPAGECLPGRTLNVNMPAWIPPFGMGGASGSCGTAIPTTAVDEPPPNPNAHLGESLSPSVNEKDFDAQDRRVQWALSNFTDYEIAYFVKLVVALGAKKTSDGWGFRVDNVEQIMRNAKDKARKRK